MIRQLAQGKILFKTKEADISTPFYLVKNTETEMDIVVNTYSNLGGCKAIYKGKTYDVKFIKHLQMVGINVSQQYKYVLTKVKD